MRPVKLTMQAFGSYGNLTQIDFQEPDQNLFLVTGDTGAGKTTIFDAIVFALYGEASSSTNKKDGVVLQSQYVELNIEPFVELVFSEGTGENRQLYTVRRVPRHLKRLTRGAGKNTGSREVTGSVSLIMPDGTEYPQKEADSKLGEILGLNKGQFMQVAMIAQGEFMELLRAKSDDKKVIFRKLFNTELYQNIVDELMNRKRSLEKDIAQIKTACQTETAHVVISQEYEKWEEMEALKKQIQNGEIVVMDQFLTQLTELCSTLRTRIQEAQKDLDTLSKLRDEKRDAYTSASQLQGLYNQLEAALLKLKACEDAEAQIKEKMLLSEHIRTAYEIQAEYLRCQDAFGNLRNHENALKEQQERSPQLENQAKLTAEEASKVQELAEGEKEVYTTIYERVNKEMKLRKRISEAQATARESQEALQAAETAAQKAREDLDSLEKKEEEWRTQAETLADTGEKMALWKGQNQELEALFADLEDAEKQLQMTEKQKKESEKAKKSYIKIRALYESQNQKYESMRRIFLDEQAGFLARELQPGKPCPVCGALEHPHPCVTSESHADLTREQLDLAEKEASRLRSQQEQLAGEARAAADLAIEKEKVYRDKLAKLCGGMQELFKDAAEENVQNAAGISGIIDRSPLEFIKQQLETRKLALQKQYTQFQKDQNTLLKLQNQLSHVEETKKQGKLTVEETSQKLTEAIAAAKSSQDVLEQLSSSLEYPSEEAAMQEFDKSKAKWKKAARDAEDAQKKSSTASEAFVNCISLIQRYMDELPGLQKALQERQASYTELLHAKDMTESEWKPLTEEYSRQMADQLQKETDTWKQKKIAAQTVKDSASKAIDGRTKPDPELAKAQMEEAEVKRRLAQEKLDSYKEQYKADQDACSILTPQMEKRGKIIEKHAKLETLYKLLSGNMSGNRMDLETFVQRYYLEKILYAANRRFSDMSAGQFELRMVDAANAGKGKNRGLDLMVYSNVTGKEREVRTLSGGESFMAALSLALGMADQIQESSASINLDVMFVDEGFGSLDEHSREQAVKVLQELAGGSKLIGIISHVTELKQEIEDQLIVTKDEKGSHVRWQIS